MNQITSANKALTAAIAEDNRCDSSADCAVVPTGARACGGPSSYAVYSTKSANVALIQTLAQATVKLEQQYNRENSIISICSIARPPGAACNQGKTCTPSSVVSPWGSDLS